MNQKKVSSIITIIIFFLLLLTVQVLGALLLKNQDIVAIFSYLITFFGLLWYFKSRKGNINAKFKDLELKKVLKVILFCCGYFVIANIFIDFLVFNLHFDINNFNLGFTPYSNTLVGNIIFLVSLTLCPAIVEEFVFRGIIFKNFIPKHGLKSAVIITTFLFSFSHGITNGLVLFVSGGFFYVAFLYHKEKNLLYPIIYHLFNNLLCTVPQLNKVQELHSISIYMLIAFVVALPFILKNLNKSFLLDKNTMEF